MTEHYPTHLHNTHIIPPISQREKGVQPIPVSKDDKPYERVASDCVKEFKRDKKTRQLFSVPNRTHSHTYKPISNKMDKLINNPTHTLTQKEVGVVERYLDKHSSSRSPKEPTT